MSIFGNILSKIFHHDAPETPADPVPSAAAPPPAVSAQPAPPPAAPESPAATSTPVDVGAVLEAMAAMKDDRGGNYRTSIVDLLKLLDLDSSLSARKDLAEELGVHGGEPGSAEQNIALHRAVMDKLAANGGVVPDSLRQ